MADVIELDALRTDWHERAVISSAKRRGVDPVEALAASRLLRAMLKRDVRLPIKRAIVWARDGHGRNA